MLINRAAQQLINGLHYKRFKFGVFESLLSCDFVKTCYSLQIFPKEVENWFFPLRMYPSPAPDNTEAGSMHRDAAIKAYAQHFQ